MKNTVYKNHKNINVPIEFKGIKAPYLWYLCVMLGLLLLLFGLLYMLHVPAFGCIVLILSLGSLGAFKINTLSKTYGNQGLTKTFIKYRIPKSITSRSRVPFTSVEPVKNNP
ncbi:DUF4133 domain-containing protein [Zhouia sp. PK063]|uniref:DUF4133 domain-containing protein n=1 Tax=Zhouia sp. PK063 TaxID=3373602 RepID=UPI00379BEA27